MKAPSKWDRFVDWIKGLRWLVKCRHPMIVMIATMDSVVNWERFSGSGICNKCGTSFHVAVAANEAERMNEHYLGY